MLKKSFKKLLKTILVMFFVGLFGGQNAFAEITGNNSFSTAYSFGYWEYHPSGVTSLPADKNDAFYSFRINKGDRVYVSFSFGQEYLNHGLNLQILNSNGTPKTLVKTTVNTSPTSNYRFIFENINGENNSETFYIKVNRGNYIGNMVFVVGIEKRIYSGHGVFDFVGSASNPGNNPLITPNGTDSSIITLNLTNNNTIPNGAIVKSLTTTGSTYPNKNGLIHKISSSSNNIWYTSSVVGSNYPITVNDGLKAKSIWSFRYNQKASGSSTMSNAKVDMYYEYDITDGF
ncbi:hypothetical protein CRU92_10630 [Arcobacter sp. FW59]|nr:hypothetical protein CRU92_10630 [Arcobacter sp. FW59]